MPKFIIQEQKHILQYPDIKPNHKLLTKCLKVMVIMVI